MVRALPVIGGVLLCAVNCARAFMPTPVQSISIVTKPCEQGMDLNIVAAREAGSPKVCGNYLPLRRDAIHPLTSRVV